MRNLLAPVVLFVVLATAACSAETSDSAEPEALADESALSTGAVFHGRIKLDESSAKLPSATFHDPFTWDRDDAVVPAALDPAHPSHSWEIEITEELELNLMSESIKVAKNGAPDVDFIASRFLDPKSYPVADLDTVMVLFKKDGADWKFVGKNDDGLNKGKGSYLSRKAAKGSVYKVIVSAKSASATANVGLFIQPRSLHPSDP